MFTIFFRAIATIWITKFDVSGDIYQDSNYNPTYTWMEHIPTAVKVETFLWKMRQLNEIPSASTSK